MSKDKILLIAGCSHAAGSEIDGEMDSVSNRKNSFGNKLAEKLGRTAINIASTGSTNPTIARSVQEWVNSKYNSETMDVFVLVAWTEPFRMEVTAPRGSWYSNTFCDWKSTSDNQFLRITPGYTSFNYEEKSVILACNRLMAASPTYVDIVSANLILQLQYFFKAHSIDYAMCNIMEPLSVDRSIKQYIKLIDKIYYKDMLTRADSFYWKYVDLGYTNAKAEYFHHGAEPHALYADELYNFIKKQYRLL